jgi:hypothetical protein
MKEYILLKKESLKLLPFYLFFIILTIAVSNNSFFWDTIQLASKHAHWYFENNFKYFLLPDSIDSGHIPAFGILLAFIWKIFQKSLFVSHIFMLPFLIGIVYQSYKIISHFINNRNRFYVLIIFLLDPTLLSQSILVSPDIVLVFFFLFSLNMILHNRRKYILFGILALSLVSMRGMMIIIILFIFDLYYNYYSIKGNNLLFKILKSIQVYIPAGILTLIYLIYHYIVKGWIGYHENSPWALCFERVNITGFIYNTGILGWRLIDFGRIILWLVFGVIVITLNKKIRIENNLISLFILFILLLVLLPLIMLLHKNLLGHRYLLPVYLVFSLLVCNLVFEQIKSKKLQKILFIIIAIGLLSGNLWVYPDKVAQGWDSTLAHVPYYRLRDKMIDYIKQRKISFSEIGTEFPNATSFKYTDLADDDIGFAENDLNKNNFIFYSNIMNDFSDEEIDELKNNWILEKEYKCLQVSVRLYKNPKYTKNSF